MTGRKKVTINDIARIAEVSKTTVSYVVNHRQTGFHISEETARRVLEICKKMNYCPDEAAVRLSEYRKAPLRLLIASPWLYAQFCDLMAQLNIVLQRYEVNFHLDISYASYSPKELKSVLRPSVIRRYDALLVIGTHEKDNQWLKANAGRLAKVVLMNRQIDGFLSCSGNDREAVMELTRKVNLRHYDRAIEVISSRASSCEQRRFDGFEAGCASAGILCEKIYSENYLTLNRQLLERHRKQKGKTLVFIPQYIPAARLLKEAVDSGLRIPEDFGIIAYDRHTLLDTFISPTLTTVDPNLEEMAGKTMEMIYDLRENVPQKPRIIKAKVCIGETTVNL